MCVILSMLVRVRACLLEIACVSLGVLVVLRASLSLT